MSLSIFPSLLLISLCFCLFWFGEIYLGIISLSFFFFILRNMVVHAIISFL